MIFLVFLSFKAVLFIQTWAAVYIFIDVFQNQDSSEIITDWHSLYELGKFILIFLVLATSLLRFIASIFLAHFLIFHLYLRCLGVTTYDYILNQKERNYKLSQIYSLNTALDTSIIYSNHCKIAIMEEPPLIDKFIKSHSTESKKY
ncbi:unnamed protein product [Blepharisma stoltei]|uniref:Protein S-acyltransferase n=1 Tax=Blepharisma stoltei TaxID=1481888 RepID=A0AAU9KKL8_9CILI|nr:unnamed protein product [Blepharisma stoltei]